ncbi:MAG: hypothetical protein KBG09_03575, partial [Syntrophobacterales bacterium]|nr:hypothetical protein [Syntrophobacterales bacterium]
RAKVPVQRTTTTAATKVPNVFFISCVLHLFFYFLCWPLLTLDNAGNMPTRSNGGVVNLTI